jgi:DNA-directed RNA polymerase specialized sigma24 family protein
MVTAVLDAIGDAISAEDVVSEVFLTVWRHADGFKARAQVSTWLLAIARNKSLSVVTPRMLVAAFQRLSEGCPRAPSRCACSMHASG